MSKNTRLSIFMAVIVALAWSGAAQAQSAAPQARRAPPQFPNMTFFITSKSGPDGANFGGIKGADKHCQALAAKAGAGHKTWQALE